MRYTVIWRSAAEQALAQIWLDADDRAAVRTAADHLDRLLLHDPETLGESRSEGTRVVFVPPLMALFKVFEEDRQVVVLNLKRSRRRP
jgi:hypothetical protein